jgi:hypothetical protein
MKSSRRSQWEGGGRGGGKEEAPKAIIRTENERSLYREGRSEAEKEAAIK